MVESKAVVAVLVMFSVISIVIYLEQKMREKRENWKKIFRKMFPDISEEQFDVPLSSDLVFLLQSRVYEEFKVIRRIQIKAEDSCSGIAICMARLCEREMRDMFKALGFRLPEPYKEEFSKEELLLLS